MATISTDRRQGVIASLAIKAPCIVASTANLTLSGEQTVDGVACVTGDRVLVKNQTTGSENGIYEVNTSTWSRSPDFDGVLDVTEGTFVHVTRGSTNPGFWYITNIGTITIGTTSVTFAKYLIGINSSATSAAINIDSAGKVGIGSVPSNVFEVNYNGSAIRTGVFTNSATSNPYGLYLTYTGTAPNGTGNPFIQCTDSLADRFYVYSNGNVVNTNNSYGAISDQKLKQDIVDATSQWNDVKNLRVRKFRLINEVEANPNALTHIGFIAQEAQAISPGLVDSSPDMDADNKPLGTETLHVKYSVAYMKLFKAFQEAQTRIETLESQNAAFKALLVSKGIITQQESDSL